ncbi:MAG: TonB-dependent receptor [Chitinophagaceae bacterium]|nr:TonB-dependent receptor [Chitinophagaceae bacterium]
MKHFYTLGLAFSSLLFASSFLSNLHAQNNLKSVEALAATRLDIEKNGTIKGRVTTTDGEPAAFVNVLLRGTSKGTLTGETGYFVLHNVKPGSYTLSISHAGLQSQEKEVMVTDGETVEISLALSESSRKLDEVVVEGRRSMNTRPATIGKAPIALIDLPQSVTIIGRTALEDQQVQRLSDVVKNINGVYMASQRAGTQETFNARGYGFSSTNMFKNGARVNSGAMPEMSSLERVEVLKGSAAILYGNVSPGAVLNMITKQPRFEFGGEVNLRAGSYGLFKPSIDIYGPISSKIAYRVNGTFETAASYRDQVHSKRYYVNPSLLFKLGNRTELLIQGDYLKHDFTPDFGIGSIADTAILKVARNTFYGAPWQYANTQQATSSANLKHRLNDNWSVNTVLSYSKYQRDYYSLERIQANRDSILRRALGRNSNNEDYYSAQVDLTGKFKTGSIEHTLLAGVDADRYSTRTYGYALPSILSRTAAIYDSVNVYDLNRFPRRTDVPVDTLRTRTTAPINRVGAYIQDLVSISEKVKILAGIRFSYLETRAQEQFNFKAQSSRATSGAKHDHAFSPRVGVVYKPVPTTAIFASYSNSFTPNTGVDIDSIALPPSIIDQYEAGVKNDFFKGMLSVNLTVYRIRNSNFSQTAPFAKDGVTPNNNSVYKALVGETLSEGIELDIIGHPLAGLDVIAGYSYNSMTIENTPDGVTGVSTEGERLVGNPNHTANASVFYTIKDSKLKGLKLGAGVYYLGQRYAGWNNTFKQAQQYNRLISVDGFTTLDFSAGYTFRQFSVLAKLSNVTNTYNYYVHENYSVNPIPPRQFTATVAYKF